jgi:hypothetical protein
MLFYTMNVFFKQWNRQIFISSLNEMSQTLVYKKHAIKYAFHVSAFPVHVFNLQFMHILLACFL